VLTPEEVAQLPEPALGERQHTHRWTVAVRSAASAEGANQVGGADDISSFIKKVNFKIWHGYPNPSRSTLNFLPIASTNLTLIYLAIETPPFEISETG
jgi:YEATS domain-containing protein 4